jgi:hypothetical protein
VSQPSSESEPDPRDIAWWRYYECARTAGGLNESEFHRSADPTLSYSLNEELAMWIPDNVLLFDPRRRLPGVEAEVERDRLDLAGLLAEAEGEDCPAS